MRIQNSENIKLSYDDLVLGLSHFQPSQNIVAQGQK
jgi:hypothetical protein